MTQIRTILVNFVEQLNSLGGRKKYTYLMGIVTGPRNIDDLYKESTM
jgi:hypothetical protein